MHIAIDVLAILILLFYFFSGWHKGFWASTLGLLRVVVAYGSAWYAGRYLGFWLGGAAHRPRIVTIPVCAGIAFVLVTFAFYLVISELRLRRAEREEKEEYRHPLVACLLGGGVNLLGGAISLVLTFWILDLFFVGMTGLPFPGSDQSRFAKISRQVLRRTAYALIPKKGNERQVEAMASIISDPASGIDDLEEILAAPSVKRLFTDPDLGEALLSGDPERVRENEAIREFFGDRDSLDRLRKIGALSETETKSGICEKLAIIGKNPRIRIAIENLKAKQLLGPEHILDIIRDPDFDVIVSEIVQRDSVEDEKTASTEKRSENED